MDGVHNRLRERGLGTRGPAAESGEPPISCNLAAEFPLIKMTGSTGWMAHRVIPGPERRRYRSVP